MKFSFKDNATTAIELENIKRIYATKADVIELQLVKNDLGKPQMIQLFYKNPEDCAGDLENIKLEISRMPPRKAKR